MKTIAFPIYLLHRRFKLQYMVLLGFRVISQCRFPQMSTGLECQSYAKPAIKHEVFSWIAKRGNELQESKS